MNRVEVTGKIIGAIDCTCEADGTEAARASLDFQRGNGLIKVFAFRELARQLANFQPGHMVRIVGRLTCHPQNRTAAILVDAVGYFDARQEHPTPRNLQEDIRAVRHSELQTGKRPSLPSR